MKEFLRRSGNFSGMYEIWLFFFHTEDFCEFDFTKKRSGTYLDCLKVHCEGKVQVILFEISCPFLIKNANDECSVLSPHTLPHD